MTIDTEQATPAVIGVSLFSDLIIALVKSILIIVLINLYVTGYQADFLVALVVMLIAAFLILSTFGNWSKLITYVNASIKYKKPYMRTSVTCPFLAVSFLNLVCKADTTVEAYDWHHMEKCHVEEKWKTCWSTKSPRLLEILNDPNVPVEALAKSASYLGIMEKAEAFPRVLEVMEGIDESNISLLRVLLGSMGHLMRAVDDPDELRRASLIFLKNQGKHGRLLDMTITESCMLAGKSIIQPFNELLSIPIQGEGSHVGDEIPASTLIDINQKSFIIRILYTMSTRYPDEVFDALKDQKNLENDFIRSFRAKILAMTRKEESIPLLLEILLDNDDLVVNEARKGLRMFGTVALNRLVDLLFDEQTSDDLFDESAATIETFELQVIMRYLQELEVEDREKYRDVQELARNNDIKKFLLVIDPESQKREL